MNEARVEVEPVSRMGKLMLRKREAKSLKILALEQRVMAVGFHNVDSNADPADHVCNMMCVVHNMDHILFSLFFHDHSTGFSHCP